MKIGILGSGNMGRALGMRWAMNGHEVFFGGRDNEKTRNVAALVGHGSKYGTNAEAVEFGDVLLHCIRDVLPTQITHSEAFKDKILIDLNNHTIPEGFAYEPILESFSERYQKDVPSLRVVKAFNTYAMEMFEHTKETIAEHDISAFIAGDDKEAKNIVSTLASELGFTPIDVGDIRQTRLIESLGDFIRLMIIDKNMGSFAHISTSILPSNTSIDLGGRYSSNFK